MHSTAKIRSESESASMQPSPSHSERLVYSWHPLTYSSSSPSFSFNPVFQMKVHIWWIFSSCQFQQTSVFKVCKRSLTDHFRPHTVCLLFSLSPPPPPKEIKRKKEKRRRYLSNTKAKSLIMKSWNLCPVNSVSVSRRLGTVHDCSWLFMTVDGCPSRCCFTG